MDVLRLVSEYKFHTQLKKINGTYFTCNWDMPRPCYSYRYNRLFNNVFFVRCCLEYTNDLLTFKYKDKDFIIMEDLRSRHYADVANWICKVIRSCENYKQISTARELYSNWRILYQNKVDYNVYYYLTNDMRLALDIACKSINQNSNVK